MRFERETLEFEKIWKVHRDSSKFDDFGGLSCCAHLIHYGNTLIFVDIIMTPEDSSYDALTFRFVLNHFDAGDQNILSMHA